MTTTDDADLLAFADEAGFRGLLRDLREEQDHEIGVVCTLPIQAEHVDLVRRELRPMFDRFKAAAPPGAKLHITDAFKSGNEEWAKVAREVRHQIFMTLRELGAVVIYSARRARLARERFDEDQKFIAAAKAASRSPVTIVGANRPSDERIEDVVMKALAIKLDEFALQEERKRVDVMFDQVDAPVAARYEEALEATRHLSGGTESVHGWDPTRGQRVSGEIAIKVDAPFELDSQFIGKICVVGKEDALIFAVDVVANHLWRHLAALPPDAPLNAIASVRDWVLGDRVWPQAPESHCDKV